MEKKSLQKASIYAVLRREVPIIQWVFSINIRGIHHRVPPFLLKFIYNIKIALKLYKNVV